MFFALLPLAGCGPDPSTPADAAASASASSSTASPRASGVAVSTSASPTASASATTSEPPAPAPGPRPSDAELKELTKANNAFTFALWSKVASKKGDLAFSPFSLESALAMTWLGAKGETAAQMKKTLGFESAADGAADIAGRYTKSLGGAVTIRVANRLFGEKTYSFEKGFLDATAKDFDAPLPEAILAAFEGR